MQSLGSIIEENGLAWTEGKQYPSWVDLSEAGLEQFYTLPETAIACYEKAISFLSDRGIAKGDCLFVEPSAGNGAFSSILPAGSIALDLDPRSETIEKMDFLTWNTLSDNRIASAKESDKKIVAIGNPPYGARGWMALSFLNKCSEFADYCFFLLPMSFASDGKGSPKYRVVGMRNVESEEILREQFVLDGGKSNKLNVVWQTWERGSNVRETFDCIDEMVIIKCIGDFPYRLCGQKFKDEADVFVSQGYFPGTPMSISRNWDDILYGSGYGIKVIDGHVDEVLDALVNADWDRFSTASTHGCRHVGMTEIKKVLQQAMQA